MRFTTCLWSILLTLLLTATTAAAETLSNQWLDDSFKPTEQDEAIYKVVNHEEIEGGFSIQINFVESDLPRFKGQVRALNFDNLEAFGDYTLYRSSGEVMETGSYNEHGQRHGMVTGFQEDGQISREMPFVEGKLHGLYLTFTDGTLVRELEYQEGERHGRLLHYYPSGEKNMEEFYSEGKRSGTRRTWKEDGQLVAKDSYKDGQKHGASYQYFEDGSVRRQSNHLLGRERGEQITYFSPGQVNRYRRVDEDGKTIEERRYDSDGQLIRELRPIETDYGKGSQQVAYTASGRVSNTREESNDKRWSLVKRFDADGTTIERTETLDKQPHGEMVRRWRWNIIEHGQYKDGELHGRFYAVNDEGEVVTEGEYRDGQKIGTWDEFDGYNRIVQTYNDKGQLHGEYKKYSADGVLTQMLTYQNGVKQGLAETYTAQGELTSKGEYLDDQRHGEWEEAVAWGENQAQGSYRNGVQVGPWTTTNSNGHRIAIDQFDDEGYMHQRQFKFGRQGELEYVIEYRHGIRHGLTTYYFFGQLSSQERYREGSLVEVLDDEELIELQ